MSNKKENKIILCNKDGWNVRTQMHYQSSSYAVDDFLRTQDSLKEFEYSLIGDIYDLNILHLQCGFGMDSLSLANKGAHITGIDFSSEAIHYANLLKEKLGTKASFIETNVFETLKYVEKNSFDMVISIYGITTWLDNLDLWADIIYHVLKPNGRFLLIDFHPILEIIFNNSISGMNSYFNKGTYSIMSSTGTYADPSAKINYTECRWQHPISEIVQALINSNFKISKFEEHPFNFQNFFLKENFVKNKNVNKNIPYIFSLIANKESLHK